MKSSHLHKIKVRADRVRALLPSPEKMRRFMLSQGKHAGDIHNALADIERFFDVDLPELLGAAGGQAAAVEGEGREGTR